MGRPGAYDAMEHRIRGRVTAGMAKLRAEWPSAFEAGGATLEALSALAIPILLIAGGDTTAAAGGVIEILRGIWPEARHGEIAGAGHMAPVSHADPVNPIIENFLETATGPALRRTSPAGHFSP